jgi:hypothetical protein
MDDTIENRVKIFISEYWHYNVEKLNLDTTLDDIGFFGDDKYDFIISFAKYFNLNVDNFNFKEYVDDEVFDLFNIKKVFMKVSYRKTIPIKISKLINWVEKNEWI